MLKTDYLKYLWHSTNEHGVHSPFVFSLVTRGLYHKKRQLTHPALKGLELEEKLPPRHFRALNNSIYHLLKETPPLNNVLLGEKAPDPLPASSIMVTDLTSSTPPSLETLLHAMHHDTVLIVIKQGTPPFWEELKAHENIHLTIDCFYMGFVFKRHQQAKEDFTIRL